MIFLYSLLLLLCLWVGILHNSGWYITCEIASEHQALELLDQEQVHSTQERFQNTKAGEPELSPYQFLNMTFTIINIQTPMLSVIF